MSGAATDDGGLTIVPHGSTAGAWRRVYDGPLEVEWFGAVSNGAADEHEPFQRACDALGAVGGTIALGPRTYRIGATVNVPRGVGFAGAGTESTRIVGAVVSGGPVLAWRGTTAVQGRGGFLRDLWLWTTVPSKTLVVVEQWAAFDVTACRMDGATDGAPITSAAGVCLLLDGVLDVTLLSSRFQGAAFAALEISGALSTTVRAIACSFRQTKRGPGATVEGLGIQFDGCIFESNGELEAALGHGLVVRRGVTSIRGAYFENNRDADLVLGTESVPLEDGAAYATVDNPVFRPGTALRVVGAPCIDARNVRGGAILAGDYSGFVEDVRLGPASQCVFVAGALFGRMSRPGGVDQLHGLVQRMLPEGGLELTGRFGLRVGGGELLRAHRSFTVPMSAELPPGTTSVVVPVPPNIEAAFGDVVATSYRVQIGPTPSGGLPPHVLVGGSVTGNAPAQVTITFFNAATFNWTLAGVLRVDLWRH